MTRIRGDDPYVPTQSSSDTLPELESAIAATVVSSIAHPERSLKRGALLATAWLVKLTPSTTVNGLQLALESNLDPAGKTWLLWLIVQFEAAPYPITQGCLKELTDLTQSPFLTVRSLATQVLIRAGVITLPPPATDIRITGV